MAFNFFLRRASASILPLGIRSAGGVIPCFRRQFLPISRFSSTAGDDIVRLIESDYSAQKSSNNMNPIVYIPDGFPYEIEDTGENLSLRRRYHNERIRVYVDSMSGIYQHPPYMQMSAYILRGTQDLEFEMEVEGDDISISNVSISDLHDGHLEGFEKYLKIRGLGPSTINFLLDYIEKHIEK